MKRFTDEYLSELSKQVNNFLQTQGSHIKLSVKFVQHKTKSGAILLDGTEPFAEVMDETLFYDQGTLSQTKLWDIADAMQGLAGVDQFKNLDFYEDGYVYQSDKNNDYLRLRTILDENMSYHYNIKLSLIDIKNILSIMSVQQGLLSNDYVDDYMNEYDKMTNSHS